MSLRRTTLLVPVLLLLAVGVANAQVGKNFEKGGIAIMGSGSFYTDLSTFADSTNTYSKWTFNLGPEVDFFFLDSTTFYVGPYFGYSSTTYSSTSTSAAMNVGVDVGLVRYFVLHPSAGSGLVPALGAQVGFEIDPGQEYLSSGTSYTAYTSTWADVAATVRLYYFLNDTMSLYVNAVPRLWYELNLASSTGTSVNLTAVERLQMDVTVSFGVSYWIPRSKLSVIR